MISKKIPNFSLPSQNSYALWYKPQSPGVMMGIKKLIKKFMGVEYVESSIAEVKTHQLKSTEDLEETKRLLTLNGENEWMLNLCREKTGGKKECLPNDK